MITTAYSLEFLYERYQYQVNHTYAKGCVSGDQSASFYLFFLLAKTPRTGTRISVLSEKLDEMRLKVPQPMTSQQETLWRNRLPRREYVYTFARLLPLCDLLRDRTIQKISEIQPPSLQEIRAAQLQVVPTATVPAK